MYSPEIGVLMHAMPICRNLFYLGFLVARTFVNEEMRQEFFSLPDATARSSSVPESKSGP